MKVSKSKFTKPKKDRIGQREINLKPQEFNNIVDKIKPGKMMHFVPGIQQPEMSLQSAQKSEKSKNTAR